MAVAIARYTSRQGGAPRLLYPEDDNSITRAAMRVWNALVRRGALASWLDFSPSRLAAEIDMCRASMFAALRELTMKGYLLRARIGRLTRARCVTPQSGRERGRA